MSEVETEDIYLTEEGRLRAWRLLELMRALREHRPNDPITMNELELIGVVAAGVADLHDACDALKRGCGCQRLVDIFT